MKITAYITDCCGLLHLPENTFGLDLQEDIFDKYNSFKTIPNPDKATVHYCMDCFRRNVVQFPTLLKIDRKKNEDAYTQEYKMLSYRFKLSVINKAAKSQATLRQKYSI